MSLARQHQVLAEMGMGALTISTLGHLFGDVAGALACLWYAVQLYDRFRRGWQSRGRLSDTEVEPPETLTKRK